MSLKSQFIEAIKKGELGTLENGAVMVTAQAFKAYFPEIKTHYVKSFLPAATLQPGQTTMTHTRFLFRVKKGLYRVHPDALK